MGQDLPPQFKDGQTEPGRVLSRGWAEASSLVPEAGPGSSLTTEPWGVPEREGAHLLLLLSQAVPHGGHDFGHVPEGRAGVLSLDGGLSVSEEECVC